MITFSAGMRATTSQAVGQIIITSITITLTTINYFCGIVIAGITHSRRITIDTMSQYFFTDIASPKIARRITETSSADS